MKRLTRCSMMPLLIVLVATAGCGELQRDERPPIIVRNGSIDFETQDDWTSSGAGWVPNRPKGAEVISLRAAIRGATGNCTSLDSDHFTIRYSVGTGQRVFQVFVTESGRPMVTPRGLLSHDSANKRLRSGNTGEGFIERITASDGQECVFEDATGEITISFSYS